LLSWLNIGKSFSLALFGYRIDITAYHQQFMVNEVIIVLVVNRVLNFQPIDFFTVHPEKLFVYTKSLFIDRGFRNRTGWNILT
jgi:hypothetical protein